ncbi:MAG: DUF4402 domain-containing protein [Proteobacteria bacterium]|nr:DUF4402 domain-containing protein [Pseudomonadota bacterium]
MNLVKISVLAILAGASASVLAGPAPSGNGTTDTNSTTINAAGQIDRPITLTKTIDFNFGTLVRPASGSGNAIIDASGNITLSGGVTLVRSSSSSVKQGQFRVNGEAAQAITVTVPATMTMSGPNSSSITVTLAPDHGTASETLSGTQDDSADGTLVCNVGGTVPVAAATTTGQYTGSYTVSATYN